jgi:hypothetical protein
VKASRLQLDDQLKGSYMCPQLRVATAQDVESMAMHHQGKLAVWGKSADKGGAMMGVLEVEHGGNLEGEPTSFELRCTQWSGTGQIMETLDGGRDE